MVTYVLKIKGISKIPDYIQIRDSNFVLIAYFRADRVDVSLEKLKLTEANKEILANFIKDLPFGVIKKIAFTNDCSS